MNLKHATREYFNFSLKERIGIFVLLALLLVCWLLPFFYAFIFQSNPTPEGEDYAGRIQQIEEKQAYAGNSQKPELASEEDDGLLGAETNRPISNVSRKRELFYFDPNNLSVEGWKRLDLRDKTIQVIQNYLARGGHFHKPDDMKKIYGLRPDEFERLRPFIKIEGESKKYDNAGNSSERQPTKILTSRYKPLDINHADTTEWVGLPGIGSKLAARIVNFREKLGGFYSIGQIQEVYALPDSTFQKIKPFLQLSTSAVRKININRASKEEMRTHPYIRGNLANAIEMYRKMHGNYEDIADLKKIDLVNVEVFEKLKPYLAIE